MKPLLALKFFLWGMVIFVTSVFIAAFHGCEDWELKSTNIRWLSRYEWKTTKSDHVGILRIDLDDNSVSNYLQVCATVARDLKKSGAKVILVPIPEDIAYTEENRRLVERIGAIESVLVGSRPVSDSFYGSKPMSRRGIDWWWVEHPFVHRLSLTWAPSTMSFLRDFSAGSILNEFIPFGVRETHGKDFLPDIALEAIRRYKGDLDGGSVRREVDAVFVGNHRIPVWGDGVAYTKRIPYPPWEGAMAAIWKSASRVEYEKSTFENKKMTKTEGNAVLAEFKGKIVILDWFPITSTYIYPTYGILYWQIISSILEDNLVSRHDEWDVAVMVFFVALAAFAFFRLKPFFAIIITMLLAGSTLYCSLWMFDSLNVLFDPLYPLIALGLSGVILPIVKLAHEKHALTEEVKSMNERVKALEGELKNEEKAS